MELKIACMSEPIELVPCGSVIICLLGVFAGSVSGIMLEEMHFFYLNVKRFF
jgi:hypothetical protein